MDSEEEPVYVPPMKSHVTKFGPSIDYEKFKFRPWREFRKPNGHGPIFSMVFRYPAIAGMLASMIVFFWVKDHHDWEDLHSLLVGGTGPSVGWSLLLWSRNDVETRFENVRPARKLA